MLALDKYIDDIKRLCALHKVKHLYVFGSALSDRYNDQSDVDMIVAFNSTALPGYADNYYDLKFSLEDMLQKPVDLLEEQAIKNPYFKESVDKQKKLIYGY